MKILELLVLLLLAAESWISSQEWKKLVQDLLDAQITDTITWTSLVAGLKACGGVGALKRGHVMHAEISKRGMLEKDVIANATISMHSKWGRISGKDSTKLKPRDMNLCDVVSPGNFHEGGKQCFWERTEATLRELQEAGHRPSFEACSSVSDVDKGQEIHVELVEEGFDSGYLVGSALASGYAKCGFTVDPSSIHQNPACKGLYYKGGVYNLSLDGADSTHMMDVLDKDWLSVFMVKLLVNDECGAWFAKAIAFEICQYVELSKDKSTHKVAWAIVVSWLRAHKPGFSNKRARLMTCMTKGETMSTLSVEGAPLKAKLVAAITQHAELALALLADAQAKIRDVETYMGHITKAMHQVKVAM
ncbi:hypothetical protein L7F22_042997 [Adiantum nelumboides]|nr:hypothetical protein [Adiantum nelumboides]